MKGALSRMKQVAGNATISHCVIHRHSLAIRRMLHDIKVVLIGTVKIINSVKSRPLPVRLLKRRRSGYRSLPTLAAHRRVGYQGEDSSLKQKYREGAKKSYGCV
ncbi:hypothetical protein J437_LFUL002450 [Ladona fulva]|uniref:Uncharacterized protein n=1 Tax=Ladona fulva TaxID=123851 RepID=A0A8K0KM37_LADFU|nr:hypothetical protein J437_LFUL002450 [Ladona fulva]